MSQDYSDDESLNDVQIGDVDLGFVDMRIPSDPEDAGEIPTIEDTLLGGNPIWLKPTSLPDEKLVTCDNCGKKMALYFQTFAPFGNTYYDRVLYIFGCKQTTQCSGKKGSIKCIRGISKDEQKMNKLKKDDEDRLQKEMEQKLKIEADKKLRDEATKDLFKKDETVSNPFATSPFGASPFGNPFGGPFGNTDQKEQEQEQVSKEKGKDTKNQEPGPKEQSKDSYASIANKKTTPKSNPSNNYTLPSYPGYFLYTEKEKFDKVSLEPELEKYKDLIDNNSIIEEEEGPSDKSKVNPQMSKISNMLEDQTFETFSTTVQHNSTQVLRYDLGGKPLLYNGKDDVYVKFSKSLIPTPAYNPGSKRQFELQLMPKAIMDLEDDSNANAIDILNGMSWGTIIVCTDEEDFMPKEYFDDNNVGYVEEYCGVQFEESVSFQ